jgi:hypothetical protein
MGKPSKIIRCGGMKAGIALLLLLVATTGAVAQGLVAFQNVLFPVLSPPFLYAPVSDASGHRIIGPGPYVADLFWSISTNTPMDVLAPVGRNTSFSTVTDYGGGWFSGGIINLPSTYILVQVRAWDTNYGSTYYEARDNGGEFGYSNIITIYPCIAPCSATYMTGLQSFQLQRLPRLNMSSTPTNALLFTWPTNISTYALQQNGNFDSTNWITLTNGPLVVGSQNQVTLPKAQGAIFYRLISQ